MECIHRNGMREKRGDREENMWNAKRSGQTNLNRTNWICNWFYKMAGFFYDNRHFSIQNVAFCETLSRTGARARKEQMRWRGRKLKCRKEKKVSREEVTMWFIRVLFFSSSEWSIICNYCGECVFLCIWTPERERGNFFSENINSCEPFLCFAGSMAL